MNKRTTLSFQIWKNFTISILILSIAFSFLFYIFMSNFIKDQIFQSIEFEQSKNIENGPMYTSIAKPKSEIEGEDTSMIILNSSDTLNLNKMEIGHIEIIENNPEIIIAEEIMPAGIVEIKISDALGENVRGKIREDADKQTALSQRYSMPYEGKELLYVVNKNNIDSNQSFSYSYVVKDLRKIIMSQFKYLYFAIILIIISMLYPAKLIANKITKPLAILQGNMESIANKDWTNPIKVTGVAEISSLSDSCEEMRIQILEYDKNNQIILQEISHELKTPIMVIKSYIQAIRDGMFRENNINKALDIIEKEASRLEKRSLDLIYITNLDFLKYKGMNKKSINLKNQIEELHENMIFLRTDINWNLKLEEIKIDAYESVFMTAIENIMDNQVRYAKTRINIALFQDKDNIYFEIENDGESIELPEEKLFAPFEKGKEGKSGLGLYISKKILELHEGNIKFKNLEEGVRFYVKLTKKF